eukprot:Blabericola_migrator_1__9701@NODE_530_length_7799_cov_81_595447_g404_i0_p4_GENE_NODE_530_length_7799_cov_81_595447_g404_i0NODE_530_length_7799_cov_81_595447_g404_i0_p4_ORF_typecomplete_len340_score63_04Aldo_ket_red/PF00248_21/8e06Aldo_ket_red/PF00248_21/2_1e37Luteo_PO/PF04662_13/0_22_NODE_530_length_7799_cov_81_595447_g404_i018992918
MSVLCAEASNGVLIPVVGFGTWRLPNDESTSDVVQHAVNIGYAHVDCAIVYNNQTRVREGLNKAVGLPDDLAPYPEPCSAFRNVPLEEYLKSFDLPHGPGTTEHRAASKGVFLTSKVFTDTFTPDGVRWSVNESTQQLGRPIDLMLLHWPIPNTKILTEEEMKDPALAPVRLECWRTLEELYAEKKVRAIGVSNFMEKHLVHLIRDIQRRRASGDSKAVVPMTNQLEVNPYCSLRKSHWDIMTRHKILTTAYSTLGPKDNSVLDDSGIQEIATRLNRSPYQIALRWALQCGYLIIPRSRSKSHIEQNLDLRFHLDDDAMDYISSLHTGARNIRDPTLVA